VLPGDNARHVFVERRVMSEQSQQPSFLWEIIIATMIGAAAGVWLDNVVVGSGIGIGLGIVLSVLKITRAGRDK
jgi:hypothetical protein